MLRNQKYRICKICGRIGGDFVTRKKTLATGKIVNYPENKCTLCANEESRNRYYKLKNNPKWAEKKRKKLRAYKKSHPELIKEQARIYWLKNKEEITCRRNLRKSVLENKKRKKNSHHRIPAKDHPLRKFDFRKPKTIQDDWRLYENL